MAAVLIACGTVQMTFHTDVKSPDEVEQSMSLRVDGELAKSMKGGFDAEKMKAEGWTISEKTEGEVYTLTASKTMDKESAQKGIVPSLTPEEAKDAPTSSFEIKESLLAREYRLKITIPPTSAGIPTAPQEGSQAQEGSESTNPELEKLGVQMLQEMIKISWKISLPGEIVETNADQRESNTATWHLDILGLEKGRELLVVSRESRPITLQTEVKSPTEMLQTVAIRADQGTGEVLQSGAEAGELRTQGWQVSLKPEGDGQLLTLAKTMDKAAAEKNVVPMLSGQGPTLPATTSSLEVKENLFDREYRLKVAIPASGAKPAAKGQQSVQPSWRITLPGEIMDSNAEKREGSSGIWYVDPRTVENPRELSIASRESKPVGPYIAGAGAAALIIVAGAAYALMRRRSAQGRGITAET